MVGEHEIRVRSYLLWEAEGRPDGRELEFWFRAEAELEKEARCAAAPWKVPEHFVLPRLRISTPPRHVTSMRVAMRSSSVAAVATAAMQ